MLITDYLRSKPDLTWDVALQCGVRHAVIRLPEDDGFDPADPEHLKTVLERFENRGIVPVIVEPLPNSLHDHIKLGDGKRDECIEAFIKLMKNMSGTSLGTVCFNFMAHYGWTRTSSDLPERGGARVTGFDVSDFADDGTAIPAERIWGNYFYFIKAVLPYAEKYGIKLALHPDDPPLEKLGGVSRIFVSFGGVMKGIDTYPSPNLGLTFCQANYLLMGEDLKRIVPLAADRIFFVHFRNVTGNRYRFRETFHDNGEINMADMMRLYAENGVDVPIRVDHVPDIFGERSDFAGYGALGRMFAIGYLRGLIEGVESGKS